MWSSHNLRKTLLCLTCRTFICDKCLVTRDGDAHFGHKTSQLSTMAYDVFDVFTQHQSRLQENLAKISEVRPQDWKVVLRKQLLDFFESIQAKIEALKNY